MSGSLRAPGTAVRGGAHLRVLSDERLVRMAAAGDRRAFAAIHQRHSDALYRYCRTIVRDPDDAGDALQSTLAKALAALDRGVPDAPLRPWLFRIAHNESVSLLRRRRPDAELSEDQAALGADVQATVAERERLRTLVADLRALPERQRAALVMRELSGLSHAEIAAALDIGAPQAKQAILEARLSLLESEKGRAMRCADVRALISEQDGRRLRGRAVRAHLRGCDDCRALRDAIGRRREDLALLAPPLATGGLAALLGGLFGGGGGIGGGGGGLIAKVAVGAAVVGGAGGGGYAIKQAVEDESPRQRTPASVREERPAAPEPAAADAEADPVLATTTTKRAGDRPAGGGKGGSDRGPRAFGRARRPADRPRRSDRARPAPAAVAPAATAAPAAPPAATPTPEAPANGVKPEKTPRPERTPRPKKNPRPVKTPRPAKTPKPVKTPKPDPTPTPTPTRTPRPTPSPRPTLPPRPEPTPRPERTPAGER